MALQPMGEGDESRDKRFIAEICREDSLVSMRADLRPAIAK